MTVEEIRRDIRLSKYPQWQIGIVADLTNLPRQVIRSIYYGEYDDLDDARKAYVNKLKQRRAGEDAYRNTSHSALGGAYYLKLIYRYDIPADRYKGRRKEIAVMYNAGYTYKEMASVLSSTQSAIRSSVNNIIARGRKKQFFSEGDKAAYIYNDDTERYEREDKK